MADFGVQSTSITEAQGAGNSIQSPVAVNEPASPWTKVLGDVGKFLASGVEDYTKQKAIDQKNAILKGLSQKQAAINDAQSSGAINATEADTRSRQLWNQAIAANPELHQDINGLYGTFKQTTSLGTAEQQLQDARQQRSQLIQSAQQNGFIFPPNATPQQEDAIIQANQRQVYEARQMDRLYKQQQEARSQGTYDQQQHDRELKDQGFQSIVRIAGDTLPAFDATIQGTIDQARSGKITWDQAKSVINQQYGTYEAAITAVSQYNPEAANSFRSIFKNKYDLALQMADPKAKYDELNTQYNATVTQAKLLAIQDPETLASVATSELFRGSNVPLQLQTARITPGILSKLGQASVTNGMPSQYAPQVVGNPSVEGDAFKAMQDSINNLRSGKRPTTDQSVTETSNVVNNLLLQTGKVIDNGAGPQQLKNAANFFASPEYAWFVQNGKLDPIAAQAAKRTFQVMYEPAVSTAIAKQLDSEIKSPAVVNVFSGEQERGEMPTFKAIDRIDINYTGAGVVFSPKSLTSLEPEQRQAVQAKIAELRQAQVGLNTLIHIGAHMEGTTDYKKYWEENKQYLLPNIYPDPNRLKPGQVVQGKKYIGGDYRNPSNWVDVNGG